MPFRVEMRFWELHFNMLIKLSPWKDLRGRKFHRGRIASPFPPHTQTQVCYYRFLHSYIECRMADTANAY